jgi:hypothetical protein
MFIFFVIVLVSAHFYHHMIQQKRFSHRMGQGRMMTKVAYALATLTIHKLKFSPVVNENDGSTAFPVDPGLHRIFSWLAKPLGPSGSMGDLDPVPILLSDPATVSLDKVLGEVVGPLKQPLSHTSDFTFELSVSGREKDFEGCGLHANGYAREKRGILHILVKTRFTKENDSFIAEEFRFASRVKVVSALSPLLSKFSLYVENCAIPGSPLIGNGNVEYNVVSVDDKGIPDTTLQPIVLNNDGGANLPVQTTFQDFVTAKRGLVYLGGPDPVILNVARSPLMSPPAASTGEEFQFYCNRPNSPTLDPSYCIGDRPSPDGKTSVLVFEVPKGVSSSGSPTNSGYYDPLQKHSPWGKLFVDSYRMTFSSIFRLFGVETLPSPTLVLGNVHSAFLMMRFFKILPAGTKPIPLEHLDYDDPKSPYNPSSPTPPTVPTFKHKINTDYFPIAQAYGLSDTSAFDWPTYLRYFSSRVTTFCDQTTRNWNAGLRYLFQREILDSQDSFCPKMKPFISLAPIPGEALHQIPEPFQTILAPETGLKDMKPFLDLGTKLQRLSYQIDPEGDSTDWISPLKRRGLFSQNKLALNGWVFLRKPFQLEIVEPLEFLCNGGLILEEGNIIIKQGIRPSIGTPTRKSVTLQIVALNGNIILDTPTGAEIHANLIAYGPGADTGKIVFSGRPKVIGGMAMRKLVCKSEDLATFRGADVAFYPALAALPQAAAEDVSEFPLLTFNFESSPVLLR